MKQHNYRKLNLTRIQNIEEGEQLFLTFKNYNRKPVLITNTTPSALCFVYNEDLQAKIGILPFHSYGKTWYAEERVTMHVETPHGTLRVQDKCDGEYPGFYIDLIKENGQEVTLSMTEYIPGGEGTCSFNPTNGLSEMRQEDNEVPLERRTIRSDIGEDTPWYCRDEVTEGFVTRAWPNETQNCDYHKRVFHYGYQKKVFTLKEWYNALSNQKIQEENYAIRPTEEELLDIASILLLRIDQSKIRGFHHWQFSGSLPIDDNTLLVATTRLDNKLDVEIRFFENEPGKCRWSIPSLNKTSIRRVSKYSEKALAERVGRLFEVVYPL